MKDVKIEKMENAGQYEQWLEKLRDFEIKILLDNTYKKYLMTLKEWGVRTKKKNWSKGTSIESEAMDALAEQAIKELKEKI